MKTTLNKIREHYPCEKGWKRLLRNIGKTKADDEPLAITTILDSSGLDEALWCLRAVDGYEKEMRLMAVDFARSVQHLMKDTRSIDAIDVAERYANGQATAEELAAARAAAREAARSAWVAARSAWVAAWAVTLDAAGAAAGAATLDAARAAAGSAWAATWAATGSAAWAAAGSAWAGVEREVQADYLRFVCAEIEQREGAV